MRVDNLTFENYRNLKDDRFVADPGINVIYGDNAQGKTNLMEAIWLFTGVKPFSGAKDSDLIRTDCNHLSLCLDFFGQERKQNATIKIGEKKQSTLNGVKKKSTSALAGVFTAVVFSPDHLPLVKSGPAERRKFLNIAISQLWPNYMPTLYKYTRAVQQRNALLKDAKYHADVFDMLFVYEKEMARQGAVIIAYRKKYCDLLIEKAQKIYNGISSGKEKLQIRYPCSVQTSEDFLSLLEQKRKDDLNSGTTSVGPHRDDLDIMINDKSARTFGSQGQQRSAVLSIKLGEADVIMHMTGEQPVILLDDVMSELDENRQDYILNNIKDRQVFITCCDKTTAQKLKGGSLFNMRSGEIEKELFSSPR